MKNSRFYVPIILAVILLIGLISLNNGKIGITKLSAYNPSCATYGYGPLVVNAMDDTLSSCANKPTDTPPGPNGDDSAWQIGGYLVLGPPIGPGDVEPGTPDQGTLGSNYLKVTWTSRAQYIYLDKSMFENDPTLSTCPGGTGSANDWSCFDYIGFNIFLNYQANNGAGSGNPDRPQNISFYDGLVTVTAQAPVNIRITDGLTTPAPWVQHATVSLRWLANQWVTSTAVPAGEYFQVKNINSIIINAPDVLDYSVFNNGYLIAYYDSLSLGAATALPEYASPPGITVTTAGLGLPEPVGAYIRWNPYNGPVTTGVSPTAYEIYKSTVIGPGSAAGPYVSIGTVPYDPAAPISVTDSTCIGGGLCCYKILTCNNGPSVNATVERTNTVNASYHEDNLPNVAAVCGWVNAAPTFTFTVTAGTPGPTATPTPVNDINSAHVYPNPFNPNAGSKTFYVGNVAKDTKVQIYSMDGSLVMNGSLSPGDAHYHPEFYPARFEWDGKNKNGSRVVSGLYYLVLQSPDKKTKTFRIIICYKCDPVYKP